MSSNLTLVFSTISLLVTLTGCAPNGIKPTDSESKAEPLKYQSYENTQQMYEVYKRTVDQLMLRIPDQERGDRYHMLFQIKQYVYPHLYYGEITPDNQMIALMPGKRSGAWIFFVDPKHPLLEERNVTMSTGTQNEIVVVQVRPDIISERWIPVFIMHELSHVIENLYELDIQPSEREYIAYLTESLAYQLLSEEQFFTVLDDTRQEYEIDTQQELVDLVLGEEERIQDVLLDINSRLGESRPASRAEGEMRYGFYLMALMIHIGIGNNNTWAEKVEGLNTLLHRVSKY